MEEPLRNKATGKTNKVQNTKKKKNSDFVTPLADYILTCSIISIHIVLVVKDNVNSENSNFQG